MCEVAWHLQRTVNQFYLFSAFSVSFYISMWTDVDKNGIKLATLRVQAETCYIFLSLPKVHMGTTIGTPFLVKVWGYFSMVSTPRQGFLYPSLKWDLSCSCHS